MPDHPRPADSQHPDRTQEWPGERLGLPREGPRSVARVGRRLLALAIDWGLAVLVAWAFFGYEALAVTLVFVVMRVLMTVTTSGSLGQLAVGIRLVPVRGGYVGVWRPLLRTALLAVVIPAVVWDADQRGLHDRAAGTVLVRR